MIKCTVAIPTYNRRDVVGRAVDSALSQDVEALEVLVVDNCSTDGTWELLQGYGDSRLSLVRNQSNVGLFGNFNRCLALAHGQYLRFLCSDDRLIPGCLNREIAVMDAHPKVALLSTRGCRVDQTGCVLGWEADHLKPGIYPGLQAIQLALWFQAHYAYNPLNYPSGILLRREKALQAGQFDTTMRMAGDVDFFLRVLERGDLAVLNTVGCEITIHNRQAAAYLFGDMATIREIYNIHDRYRLLLEQAGTYRRVKQQLAAYALGLAFKYWRIGYREASRAHREIARSIGVSRCEMIIGIFRLFCLRSLLKITGIRLIPDVSLTGKLTRCVSL